MCRVWLPAQTAQRSCANSSCSFWAKTGTADHPGSGQVRDNDDARHALGNAGQAVLGDLLPFTVAQVGAFTGAAQRRDHVDATVDQALDALAECGQVKLSPAWLNGVTV